MKVLIPILVSLLLTTNVNAAQQWRQKPVLCEINEYAAQEFYKENNLYPMMVGAGVAPKDASGIPLPVVTYVLYNEEQNYMMVIEYHQDEICVLAVGAGVEFDFEDMNGWLGIE